MTAVRFNPTLAAVRFGSGLSPYFDLPATPDDILADIDRTFDFQVPLFNDVTPTIRDFQQASKARGKARGTDTAEATQQAFREVR